MNFTKIKEAFLISGYSRAARELLNLSDRQLEDIGLVRGLLEEGYSAYPWRAETTSQATPDNVTNFKTAPVVVDTRIEASRPKAA